MYECEVCGSVDFGLEFNEKSGEWDVFCRNCNQVVDLPVKAFKKAS